MARNGANRISFTTQIDSEPITIADWESAEDLLADMVARAIAAEHPEWFGIESKKGGLTDD